MNTRSTLIENTQKQKLASWIFLCGVILIGANLRAPLTSVGSLISSIRDDLGISNALAGSITTLPLIAFALLSPFAPKIANRIGMEWTVFLSMLLLTLGIIIRSVTGIGFLFIGTIIIGLAIAIGNVLLPAIIKMNFPLKIGIMTGVYTVVMNLFGAFGSGLSVPLSSIQGLGWAGALAVWGILSILSIVVWIPQLRGKKSQPNVKEAMNKGKGEQMWRSGLAWNVTLFMGGQSLIFYTLITWLPDILQSIGYSSSSAGWLLFLMQFSVIPINFIVPLIAEKLNNQVGLSVATGIFYLVGFIGLLVGAKAFIPIAIISIGIAAGSAFSLAMMFFTLRTTNGNQAAELSGMAQSFGYLLAATGPIIVGTFHDLTNSWSIPLLLLIFISIVILFVGIGAGRKEVIV